MTRGTRTLAARVLDAVGAVTNGTDHPNASQVAHLATAAARAADSLGYLLDLDEARFGNIWSQDGYSNDMVDDAHVRWASTSALTSLDLAIAAAAYLGGFATGRRTPSVRSFWTEKQDNRHLVPPPWRAWLDAVLEDERYVALVNSRNALVHSDMRRGISGGTAARSGHGDRYSYLGRIDGGGEHCAPRALIELSRHVAHDHLEAFAEILGSLTPPSAPTDARR